MTSQTDFFAGDLAPLGEPPARTWPPVIAWSTVNTRRNDWTDPSGHSVPMTPVAKGHAAAEDGLDHLRQEAPAFVLESLGDALFALRGTEFTSEQVRAVAERSEAVRGWLNGPTRQACFSGWFRARVKLHRLQRTGKDAIAQRPEARGRRLPYWKFPSP